MPTATPSKNSARSRADGRCPDHPVTRYARAVEAGRVVAGPYIRAACDRHGRDLTRPELDFDEVAANKALDFFPALLRLTGEGQFAGQPFVLQPWQQFIVGSLFGWFGADGYRRFQHAYIECGKVPAPIRPAPMLRSPPSFTLDESRADRPRSVIVSSTTSEASPAAGNPKVAPPIP
jgi:hypothetical protein